MASTCLLYVINMALINRSKSTYSQRAKTKSFNQIWIKNLFLHSLRNSQVSLLKKGNKFAIAPSKIPVLNIISGVELGRSQVNFANKCLIDSTRSKVVEILKRAKPPKLNLLKVEKRAMEESKQYDDIVMLIADKGINNNTVVMEKLEHNKKLDKRI